MEPLKTIDETTAPGARVLVTGPEGWEILMGEFVSFGMTANTAKIRGADGRTESHFSNKVFLLPEVTHG